MNRRILFLSSASWSFIWQRHHELASHFAKNHRVLFIENIGSHRKIKLKDVNRIWERLKNILFSRASQPVNKPQNIVLIKWFLLPETNSIFDTINARILMKYLKTEFPSKVDAIYYNIPTKVNYQLLQKYPDALRIYDNMFNPTAFGKMESEYAETEIMALSVTDLVIVNTTISFSHYTKIHQNVQYLPEAVRLDRFFLKHQQINRKENCLLYFGHISRFHFDQELIRGTAVRHPDWKIVLVGPVKDKYTFPKNVETIGQVQHQELIRYIEKANVLCMPYRKNDVMKGVFPAKTFECLATGLPTVVINVPELEKDYSDVFYIAHSNEEFITLCETAMDENDLKLRELRQKKANANTWEIRCQQFDAILEDAMLQKRGVRA